MNWFDRHDCRVIVILDRKGMFAPKGRLLKRVFGISKINEIKIVAALQQLLDSMKVPNAICLSSRHQILAPVAGPATHSKDPNSGESILCSVDKRRVLCLRVICVISFPL